MTGKRQGSERRRLRALLETLIARHGPLGWWPVRSELPSSGASDGAAADRGYHPGLRFVPATRGGRWEVATGAVLTQNTAWTNVERALDALTSAGVVTPEACLDLDPSALCALVRPAGYFNQKSRYLRALAEWFVANDDGLAHAPRHRATLDAARPGLLAIRGVGHETADSILLYAYHLPTFVIDAYTRRVLAHDGLAAAELPYEALRRACEDALADADGACTVDLWQDAHAALVEEAKALRRGASADGDGERRGARERG